jgi:signal transduction histidine kinase
VRSLFGRIFVATFVIYPITRALGLLALWLFGAGLPFTDPPPIRHLLGYYGQAALAAYERGGDAALGRFLAEEERLTHASLHFAPMPPAGCTNRPAGLLNDKESITVPIVAADGAQYCFDIAPFRPPPSRALFEWLSLSLELACCGAVSFLLARYVARPIRDLHRAATAFAEGDLAARATEAASRRRDETTALIRAFNRMAARIAALIETQRRFIVDVSHEIRSPLARIGLAAALARRAAGGAAEEQFDRMEREIDSASRLVRELQSLASLHGADVLAERSAVELGSLLSEAIDNVAFEWPDRSAAFCLVPATGRLVVDASATLLQIAFENVLRNALFYTPADSEVAVTVARAGDRARVEIRDHGPGVPELALPRLFMPFFRVDESRTRNTGGTGIGLTIVERVVTLHGGVVFARNAAPSGLRITVELPLLSSAPAPPAAVAAGAG